MKFRIGLLLILSGSLLGVTYIKSEYDPHKWHVRGMSMFPALVDGEQHVVRENFNEIKRGDIVIAYVHDNFVVKRVIGLPGDTIELIGPATLINGELYEEYYILLNSYKTGTYTVKENEYFIMGDNRGNSFDSRKYGSVKRHRIMGVYLFRIW